MHLGHFVVSQPSWMRVAQHCLSTSSVLHLPSVTQAPPDFALSIISFPSAKTFTPPSVWLVKSYCLSLPHVNFISFKEALLSWRLAGYLHLLWPTLGHLSSPYHSLSRDCPHVYLTLLVNLQCQITESHTLLPLWQHATWGWAHNWHL